MSVEINDDAVVQTIKNLEASVAHLRQRLEESEVDVAAARNERDRLQVALDKQAAAVVDALLWAVDDQGTVTRSDAAEILERIGLEVPTKTEKFTIRVYARQSLYVEVEPDEGDLEDQIKEGLKEEIGDEWEICEQYANVPTVEVSVDIHDARRTIEVEVEMPWGMEVDDPEFEDLVTDAIREEIGDEWDFTFAITEWMHRR